MTEGHEPAAVLFHAGVKAKHWVWGQFIDNMLSSSFNLCWICEFKFIIGFKLVEMERLVSLSFSPEF